MLDAVNAGCNNYVVKPWTVDDLKEKVNNAWDMMQKTLKAKASAPPPTAAQLAAKAKAEAAAVAAAEAAQKEKLTPKAGSQKPSIRKQAAPIKKKPIVNAKAAEKNKKKSFWEKLFG
jgi:response regulator RpfG family c-di-GMP phosphodiesterase